MTRSAGFSSAEHPMTSETAWDPDLPAERIRDDILMSRSNSNSYVVASDDGDVVINTGTLHQGERHRERFEQLLGLPLDFRYVILTQSHPDHMGGWKAFDGPGVTTVAQRGYPEGRLDRLRLREFFLPRSRQIMGRKIGIETQVARFYETPEAEVDDFFDDSYRFEVGGRRFELLSAPGGETRDGLLVWLPDERVAFSGNLMGALYGQLPHLMTPRGDRMRSARTFIASVNRLLDLEPALLITGHGAPIEGEQEIRGGVTRVRDAIQHVHDETVAGMNDGKDLWTLMATIELPPHLRPVTRGRGRVSWYVRTIWLEYSGWFLFESPTELYAVPPRAVWPDLVELAGAESLLELAAAHLERGDPLHALHICDVVRSSRTDDKDERDIRIAALELLLARSEGEAFDELAYLEVELERERASGSPEP